ncbi:ead/Ea22-like family protein [Klebsiella pneumoniae]|uniref:ead/Ea22-like family protein n=1 Tax=Klebsiella pneumoniae TaxID=573 RepID=UPI002543C48A|nr:ead/Ea22-like family protein [Klebsiella pneumoniae]WII49299.1 ead/Ea22-like family protein [Klebsiella pneumoniae]HBW7756038.1 ead/Ea22-like family protein [Klebsiella pneumoniae]HDZ3082165.1 ead/Ea22-like family protein [Klebsiella pneumoniae]
MTDITELAQSHELLIANGQQTADLLRHLADNEIDSDYFAVVSECESYGKETDAELSITEFALRAAGYVDELVEALEKAQAENTAGVAGMAESYETTISMLRSRIAELESRTVTVKQGEVLVTVAGFTGCGKSAIAGEIEIAMKAIGVPVTWANGDSEKRMTGADWLTAIEMYKPTVRIVEVNIPRAAGIKVEAE